ncbi:MAG TPA: molybdopterin-binding protein [Candidatus Wallbacteria bacterium]|nr:molybdopterin-binding protein [Candidatus Wallbacteria bacterium]
MHDHHDHHHNHDHEHEHEIKAGKIAGLKIDVCIISDSRTVETDESGKWLCEKIPGIKNFILGNYSLIKNDVFAINSVVDKFIESDSMALITSGGTGISSRDVTIETLDGLYEKRLTGFGEIFRMLSFEDIGVRAMMSRATAGVIQKKVVISLPGSKNAVSMAFEKMIEPQLAHLIFEATR